MGGGCEQARRVMVGWHGAPLPSLTPRLAHRPTLARPTSGWPRGRQARARHFFRHQGCSHVAPRARAAGLPRVLRRCVRAEVPHGARARVWPAGHGRACGETRALSARLASPTCPPTHTLVPLQAWASYPPTASARCALYLRGPALGLWKAACLPRAAVGLPAARGTQPRAWLAHHTAKPLHTPPHHTSPLQTPPPRPTAALHCCSCSTT